MKKIIHVDIDYFFAQVEERDRPELKGLPVGIGGLYNGRGVLATCNYVARKFGIRSAMPTKKALQLCPNLILISPQSNKYKEASEAVFEILKDYSDVVQKVSIDEAYIDITNCEKFNNDGVLIAKEIKARIFQETKLTASAGVSYNKLLAKIGSELYKPNGLAILRPENIDKNIAHFCVGKINGVGKVTQKKMASKGIYTFGDLQRFSKLDLINMFGDYGVTLYNYCRGVDHREVKNARERKSVSVETTFANDKDNLQEIELEIEKLYAELLRRLERFQGRFIKNIFMKIRYQDFATTTIESQVSLNLESFKELFYRRYNAKEKKLRLLGLGVKFHSNDNDFQLEFVF